MADQPEGMCRSNSAAWHLPAAWSAMAGYSKSSPQ